MTSLESMAAAAAALALFATLPAAASGGAKAEQASLKPDLHDKLVGKKAPAFAFPLDGFRLVSLRRLLEAKKPVVLSFFAWHCQPCEKGLPMLVKVIDKLGRDKV